MTQHQPFIHNLQLEWGSFKGIPYFGDEQPRDDGEQNCGFMDLLSSPEKIESIPELRNDPAMRSLVQALNRVDGPMFSIGCISSPVPHGEHRRRMGYIEFAINSRTSCSDAVYYFDYFFHFDKHLQQAGFKSPVVVNWEIIPASFSFDEESTGGFSLRMIINTYPRETDAVAYEDWRSFLATFEDYARNRQHAFDDPLIVPKKGIKR